MTTNTERPEGLPEGFEHPDQKWMEHGGWRYKISHSCCGLLEVHGLQDRRLGGPCGENWEWHLLASLAYQSWNGHDFGCVIFSAAESCSDGDDEDYYCECEDPDWCECHDGQMWDYPVLTDFAAWLSKHGFGKMMLTPQWHNPNSGNECVVGVWVLDDDVKQRLRRLYNAVDYGEPKFRHG
jgi:hypothetical protein